MKKIIVVGLGPGARNYVLPIALNTINECDTLIGGKRNIQSLSDFNKKHVYIEDGLSQCVAYIEQYCETERIAVVVSGDTGFYSMLKYLKNNLKGIEIKVITGISSMSIMFSRLGFAYDDAYITSLHGKNADIKSLAEQYTKVGFLTDEQHNPSYIAKAMNGVKNKRMAVGERLSYDDEKISILTIEEAERFQCDKLCIVVVYDEHICV